MDPLWLLKGEHEAPGWANLEKDSRAKVLDVVHFDRDAWALVRAPSPPTAYEGLVPTVPPDGMYLDHSGLAHYVVDRELVAGPHAVVRALGTEAEALLETLQDPVTVLERLGRSF